MIVEYPLRWPDGWPRTPARDRDAGYKFKEGHSRNMVRLDTARRKLAEELVRLGTPNPVVSMSRGTGTGDNDSAQDPGVALYFTMNGREMAMACDRYETRATNMRSLGLAIEAMRQLERHGGGAMVERAFAGFAALPRPPTCWEVLGIAPGASEQAIRTAFKDKASQSGAGGNVDMGQLVKARDEALGKAAA